MKQTPRLDYTRLADSIRDKQLVDPDALKHTLDHAEATGALFTDLLVREGLISDWELCRVAAEVFHLAFMPVELYEPNKELIDDLDTSLLRQHILVPLDRFGDILTIAMPGMVPSEVLNEIAEQAKVTVLPVVGSVRGNADWLEANLPESKMLKALATEVESDESWGELFDVGDDAVQKGLDDIDFSVVPEDEGGADLDVESELKGPSTADSAPTSLAADETFTDDEDNPLGLDLDLDLEDPA
ncbi:MAG: hypothetical protein AAFZ65_01040 [Planctomycetota bacterium]